MERSNEMKMVVTHEVENVEKWRDNRKKRQGTISKFAENIIEYVIDSGSNIVALTFTITDEQKMIDVMQDENTRLEVIRHGVKPETNNTYIER